MPNPYRTPVYVTYQSIHAHPGGAASVTAWVVQALRDDYDVRLATPDHSVNFPSIDDAYGTSLADAPVALHTLREPAVLRRVPARQLKSLRLAAAFRDPSLQADNNCLVINTANEMSFALPAVNYIHCPIRSSRTIADLYDGRDRILRNANNAVFKTISGFNWPDFRKSVCLANSKWTASAISRAYGIQAQVVYPPVTLPALANRRLADRSPGFVCVGRITPEKRVDEAIEVVGALRQAGHDVHLHIVGTVVGRYALGLRELAARRPYVTWHSALSRADLAALLSRHRFGLHLMRNEHFGMAVAEMATAGMQVMAHRSAGPLEILGTDYPLLVADANDAVRVAGNLLDHPERQSKALDYLARREVAELFTPMAFMRSMRQVAASAIAEGSNVAV